MITDMIFDWSLDQNAPDTTTGSTIVLPSNVSTACIIELLSIMLMGIFFERADLWKGLILTLALALILMGERSEELDRRLGAKALATLFARYIVTSTRLLNRATGILMFISS